MYCRTFIFVENFHVNNLSVVLEIFHVFNFFEVAIGLVTGRVLQQLIIVTYWNKYSYCQMSLKMNKSS